MNKELSNVGIMVDNFNETTFIDMIIPLLSKNLHKPHSEALQGTINEKV